MQPLISSTPASNFVSALSSSPLPKSLFTTQLFHLSIQISTKSKPPNKHRRTTLGDASSSRRSNRSAPRRGKAKLLMRGKVAGGNDTWRGKSQRRARKERTFWRIPRAHGRGPDIAPAVEQVEDLIVSRVPPRALRNERGGCAARRIQCPDTSAVLDASMIANAFFAPATCTAPRPPRPGTVYNSPEPRISSRESECRSSLAAPSLCFGYCFSSVSWVA